MSRTGRDPLLTAVRVVLTIALMVSAAGAVIMALSVPALPLWWPVVESRLAERAGSPPSEEVRLIVAGLVALLAAMAGLAYRFLHLLRQIVDTVATGDPFVPLNAERLARMGWVAVLTQLLAVPAGVLSGWIAHATKIPPANVGVSLGGVLLALILFVLARVFRQGATMREELAATI